LKICDVIEMDMSLSIPDMLESLERRIIDIQRSTTNNSKPEFILMGDDVKFTALNISKCSNIRKIVIEPYGNALFVKIVMMDDEVTVTHIPISYYSAIEYIKKIGNIICDLRYVEVKKVDLLKGKEYPPDEYMCPKCDRENHNGNQL
jgi:hypothetical protein